MSEIFTVVLDGNGKWDHSAFPHPFLTIDYDCNNKAIQIVAIGPIAKRLTSTVEEIVQTYV